VPAAQFVSWLAPADRALIVDLDGKLSRGRPLGVMIDDHEVTRRPRSVGVAVMWAIT
jgi:hypothetical protein